MAAVQPLPHTDMQFHRSVWYTLPAHSAQDWEKPPAAAAALGSAHGPGWAVSGRGTSQHMDGSTDEQRDV